MSGHTIATSEPKLGIREKIEEVLKQPETKRRLCGEGLSAEERARRLREILGRPPEGNGKNGLAPETLAKIGRVAKLL